MRRITADFMISGGEITPRPLITIAEDGTILAVDRAAASREGAEYYRGILIAGMVNAHSHLEYSYVEGKISQGGGLPHFISSIIKIKYNDTTSDEEMISAAEKIDSQMAEEGIVAVGDHNNNDYVYGVKCGSKIHYHTFVELYDVDSQSDDESFHNGLDRVDEHISRGLAASIAPHACYTLSDGLLGLCGGKLTSGSGRRAEGVTSIHYKESVEMAGDEESDRVFAALSERDESTILVHSIYATREDIERAKRLLGDRLTVAICPLSNYFIEDRMADLGMLQEVGVRIAIGTDSLSSNRTISMIEEIKKICEVYPELPLAQIVEWATKSGAVALGIDSWAGSLEVGKRPSIVNLTDTDGEHLTDRSRAIRIA